MKRCQQSENTDSSQHYSHLIYHHVSLALLMATLKYNKLAGKSVLIFGGSSGIGFGIAEACLEAGASVTISSSQQSKLDAAVQKLKEGYPGTNIQGFACDLVTVAVEQAIESIFDKVGTVNHVIYTATDGLSLTLLQDLKPEQVPQATQMRLTVPLLLAKVAARRLDASPESSMTLTSGTAARATSPGWALSSTFAAGLVGMTRALAYEMAPVRVNCVMAGFVDTPLWARMPAERKLAMVQRLERNMPVGRAGRVEDVVEAYVWLMKDRNATGTVALSDSGMSVVPTW